MKNFTITVIHASFLEEGETPKAVAKVTTSGMDLLKPLSMPTDTPTMLMVAGA